MSQEAIYHLLDFHFDYYCIIPHTTNAQVLMLHNENGWSLPHFVPYEHHYGMVEHINQEMKAQLGLDVTTLRCFYDNEVDDENYNQDLKTVFRVYAMENHSAHWISPKNASWIDFEESNNLAFADIKQREILKLWSAEILQKNIIKQRTSWAEAGWFKEATAWIDLQLTTLGLSAVTSIQQIKIWEISCLLKIKTLAESVYFKAVSTAFNGEPSRTHLLSQLYPNHVPKLLAVNTEKQWMLMHEFAGKHLEKITDIYYWEKALLVFANMQIQAVEKVDELLASGFPDRRIDQLISQIEPLLADTRALLLSYQGLSEDELATLRSLIPQLKAMCYELTDCSIPQTLVHGDFHCRNVVLTDEGFIYFDWSDTAISHPFFDVVYFLQEYEKQLPNVADVQVRLRDVYLEPWTVYLPMEQLIEIFEKARPLTLLSRAIVDYQVIEKMEDKAKQVWEQVVPYWLKKLKQIQFGL